MKQILLFPFLVLLSCTNAQDETALFQDALSVTFDYLSTESGFLSDQMGIKNPSVFSKFAMDIDADVIRQNFKKPEIKRVIDATDFNIEESIRIWDKYRGKDLSAYLTEKHLNFLIPGDGAIDRGTNIGFGAPVFNSDTSLFFIYMEYETTDEKRLSKSHQYLLIGKTEDSWKIIGELPIS